jgi:hypothetical protein
VDTAGKHRIKAKEKWGKGIMRKRILTFILVTTTVLSFTGCGKDSKGPTDLTGVWVSKDNGGSYHEATITNDYIEINWVSPDSTSLYWAGTFTAPDKVVKEYSWVSENDKEKTDSALLASPDDTKEFTYKDGGISYETSALGTTTTMKLERK